MQTLAQGKSTEDSIMQFIDMLVVVKERAATVLFVSVLAVLAGGCATQKSRDLANAIVETSNAVIQGEKQLKEVHQKEVATLNSSIDILNSNLEERNDNIRLLYLDKLDKAYLTSINNVRLQYGVLLKEGISLRKDANDLCDQKIVAALKPIASRLSVAAADWDKYKAQKKQYPLDMEIKANTENAASRYRAAGAYYYETYADLLEVCVNTLDEQFEGAIKNLGDARTKVEDHVNGAYMSSIAKIQATKLSQPKYEKVDLNDSAYEKMIGYLTKVKGAGEAYAAHQSLFTFGENSIFASMLYGMRKDFVGSLTETSKDSIQLKDVAKAGDDLLSQISGDLKTNLKDAEDSFASAGKTIVADLLTQMNTALSNEIGKVKENLSSLSGSAK